MKHKVLKKCISLLCAAAMISSVVTFVPVSAENENLVSNSTFDYNTSGWGTYYQSGGECSVTSKNGQLALNVASAGTVSYSVQLFYDIIPLYKNGVYRISYDISSDKDCTVQGGIQQNGGNYQAYTWEDLSLTSETQTVDYTFTMEYDTDIMSRLVFNCGNYGDDIPAHTIYLDNVVVELVDDSNVDYSGFKRYEPSIVTNQVGYHTDSVKTAVFSNAGDETEFSVVNADTNEVVYTGELSKENYCDFSGENNRTGDFTQVKEAGKYYIACGNLDNSYTFEISDSVYNSVLDDSVRMLYLQRCGCEVEDDTFGHKACHTSKATIYGTSKTIDVSGGWHDAGDYGRYTVTGAKTVADLLYAYDNSPSLFSDNIGISESGNGIPDVLDEARYEIEWMLKMQDSSGGVYHKVTCAAFPGYVMPEEETDELIVTPVSTTATANFCGTMALAYEIYQDIDTEFAEKCLSSAEKAWQFLEDNPNFIFENPSDIVTGSYGDSSDKDERYWAVAQMWRATGEAVYLTKLENMTVEDGLDSANFGDYGNIAIATMEDIDKTSSVYINAKNAIISRADTHVRNAEKSPYGLSVVQHYKGGWGSNMTAANQGIILGNAYLLTGDSKYIKAANSNLNYLMGCNPIGICYFTGYGTVSPEHPHHRPSIAKEQSMKGMLVGGVHPYLEDSAAQAYCSGLPTGKCYVDNQESYSTNEVTIYWNSPLTYLLSFTETYSATRVEGDVNADGKFSVADVVIMQKWLLAVPDVHLVDWKAGDLCEDEMLNVFDLCLMKQLLIRQMNH
ncbi:MAG: glycoside hydrolase family 9 protein [Ruminococcus flavefaciens]|nr:glycoside hydrolase family 9 protein [Ruminococcus flavefaciens]MCM1061467.1 glycoside hydrolase family 9 protein [Eubacterium sp.]